MKIFLAGIESQEKNPGIDKYDNYLTTYFSFMNKTGKDRFKKFLTYFNTIKQNIVLDSGAFGAWSRGLSIKVEDYISFVTFFKRNLFAYIELDVKADKNISFEKSVELTKQNQRIMEESGLTPLPVYHANSQQYKYLEELLERYEYIMIGGMAGESFDIDKELNIIFSINSKYKRKLHGLGQTSLRICLKYPFYSVDSTTWLVGGKNSEIIVFDSHKIKTFPVYSKDKEILEIYPNIELIDYDNKKNYVNRIMYNQQTFKNIQSFITQIWKERGIEWN